MFGVFVSSFIFVFVGGPAGYVLWQHMRDRKFQAQALDYDSYSVPIPWGVADGFSQEAKTHLDGFEAEKQYRFPDEIKRDELYRLDDELTHPPTPALTQPPTPKPTPNRTGVTHGTTANQVVQPFQRTDSTVVQGVVHEPIQPDGSEETERIILECGPYKLDPDDELSVEAVEMALSIGKSQNWILKNVFPGVSKGGNSDYQTFKQIVEKANV